MKYLYQNAHFIFDIFYILGIFKLLHSRTPLPSTFKNHVTTFENHSFFSKELQRTFQNHLATFENQEFEGADSAAQM